MEMPDMAVSKWRRHTEPNMGLVEKLRGEMVREHEGRCLLFGAGVGDEGVAGRHCRGKFHGGLVDVSVQTEGFALAGDTVAALSELPPVGFAPVARSGEQQQLPYPLPLGSIQLDDIARLSSTTYIDGQSDRLAVLLYRLPAAEPPPSAAPSDHLT